MLRKKIRRAIGGARAASLFNRIAYGQLRGMSHWLRQIAVHPLFRPVWRKPVDVA